jgi:GTP-binding protein
MKIKSATFLTSAAEIKDCPPATLPEFALIGRSNVGKSSLINLLTGKPELARTSAKPGYTKLINFFHVNQTWCLVDLPGYGFVADGYGQRARFNNAVAGYLVERERLCSVFVLLDASIPPQEVDLEFIHWLNQHRLPLVAVFTKTDKAAATTIDANIEAFKTRIQAQAGNLPMIYRTSAKAKTGHIELLDLVDQVLEKRGLSSPLQRGR